MRLLSLEVTNYRNIASARLEPGRELTVICGNNGQGKTNLLEAIRSLINDKRDWADSRLLRALCDGEAYAVPRLGDEETVDKLQEDGGDVIMQITEEGDYRIKGRFNEQNSKDIMQGASVIVKSRLDDSTWKGEITSVDTSPQKNSGEDMYSYGSSDEMSQSSNYAFYVKPESLDGLMLGQHVLIEIDNGQDTSINKTGIWLYSDFICKDGKKNYVWAKNEDGKIEKRYVEIGQKDEDNGDCEIKSGLEKGDYIAYPDKSIEEGMTATTNEADVSVPPNDLDPNDNTDSDADNEGGDEDIAFDGSDEDGMAIDEDMLASMTDEEIEEYFNKLYGEEENAENADGENADAADADAAFAE